MVTGGALDLVSYRLSAFYKSNESSLNKILLRVSSGKQFQNPSGDIVDYFRNDKINQGIRGLATARRDIAEAVATLAVAEEAGKYVFEDFKRLSELVDFYHDPSTTSGEKAGYVAEFSALLSKVGDTIDSASYGGRMLIEESGSTPLISINTDPEDLDTKYEVAFTSEIIANPTGLTLGSDTHENEAAAVQTQLNKAGAYLAKVTVQSDALEGHYFLAEAKSARYSEVSDDISGIDDGAESLELVRRNIRQQATSAMMAQANMFRASVLGLLD